MDNVGNDDRDDPNWCFMYFLTVLDVLLVFYGV